MAEREKPSIRELQDIEEDAVLAEIEESKRETTRGHLRRLRELAFADGVSVGFRTTPGESETTVVFQSAEQPSSNQTELEELRRLPLGEQLTQLRAREGWTAQEFAKKSGSGINVIYRTENGQTIPRVQTLRNFRQAFAGTESQQLADALFRPSVRKPKTGRRGRQ